MIKRSWENVLTVFNDHKINPRTVIPEKKQYQVNISGELNRNTINVFTEFVGTGKNRYMITKIDMIMTEQTLPDFVLYKETMFSKIGEFLGSHDIKTGDEKFDKEYRLKSTKADDAIRLFDDATRTELIAFEKDFSGTITCKGNRIICAITGSAGNKTAFKHFKCLFGIAIKFLQKKGRVQGHAPRVI